MSARVDYEAECTVRISKRCWMVVSAILSEAKLLNYHNEELTPSEQRERQNLIGAIHEIDRAIRQGSNF